MKYIKWGVLGCSADVMPVVRLLNEMEGSQVVAVMDDDAAVAKSCGAELGVSSYSGVQDLIDDSEVNAVYIATAPSTHATYAILSMRSGKPVLVETPLADTYWDCVRMNRVSEETGVPCFVNFYYRYLPYFDAIKKYLASGAFGEIVSVELHSVGVASETASVGSELWKACAYQLDLLQHLFGVIVEAWGVLDEKRERSALSSCFRFETGIPGSALWVNCQHDGAPSPENAQKNEAGAEGCDGCWVQITGREKQMRFSLSGEYPPEISPADDVFSAAEIAPMSDSHSCQPLLREVLSALQGFNVCGCTSVSATAVYWTLERLKGE